MLEDAKGWNVSSYVASSELYFSDCKMLEKKSRTLLDSEPKALLSSLRAFLLFTLVSLHRNHAGEINTSR